MTRVKESAELKSALTIVEMALQAANIKGGWHIARAIKVLVEVVIAEAKQ